MPVEQFIAEFRVEALAISVFPRAARHDVGGLGSHRRDPLSERPLGVIRLECYACSVCWRLPVLTLAHFVEARQRLRVSLKEAKIIIENWRRLYNTVRPHSSLGYKPPAWQAT
jgi:hypothetical protein